MAAISPLKLGLARAAGTVSRVSGRGGGTSLPGKVLLRLQPDAIERLSAPLEQGSVVISATNGKTTTAALLAAILNEAGLAPVHNFAGANMPGGVASALLSATGGNGSRRSIGLFEVDEAWTADLTTRLRPRTIVLGNLFRDQLDRYGELESLAESWARMIATLPHDTTVVINADDPLLAQIPGDRENVNFFGIDDVSHAEPVPRHAADSKFCRRCGATLTYDAVQLAHLGNYHCAACGLRRPDPQVAVTAIETHGMRGSTLTISTPGGSLQTELPIPGLYNVYNAAAATAAAVTLGIDATTIAEGLAQAKAVFGRVETVRINGRDVAILLVKNPTGANEVLRTIAAEPGGFDLWIALNDKIADGRDVSWVWDADFEQLAGKCETVTCSGTRADEMALRLAYAGIDRSRLRVDPRIERSFDAAVGRADEADTRLFALPTYTALLELRTAIARRGDAPRYWSRHA